MQRNNTKFIVIEGADGTGKSTVTKLISDRLYEKHKKTSLLTREPGTTLSKVCSQIRDIVKADKPCAKLTELFLFLADRYQHAYDVLIPNLYEEKKYDFIICDRYKLSTEVFQCDPLSISIKNEVDKLAPMIEPDKVYVLTGDPKILFNRITYNRKDTKLDHFEKDVESIATTVKKYEDLYKIYKYNKIDYTPFSDQPDVYKVALQYILIDTTDKTIDEVVNLILKDMDIFIPTLSALNKK